MTAAATKRRIPLWIKLLYTAFLCVLVPYYWTSYGPQNFLWFCDVALFLTFFALWFEWSLPAGMATLAVLVPDVWWNIDFCTGLLGLRKPGMASYMFDPNYPLFVRGLSSFHMWMPPLLVWLASRLGYDRRALFAQTVLAWLVLLLCFNLTDPPPRPQDDPSKAINVNYVYGFPEGDVQTVMSPAGWVLMLMAFHPVCIYLPTHMLLTLGFGKRRPAELAGGVG
jgi:hypothetical protein